MTNDDNVARPSPSHQIAMKTFVFSSGWRSNIDNEIDECCAEFPRETSAFLRFLLFFHLRVARAIGWRCFPTATRACGGATGVNLFDFTFISLQHSFH